MLYYRSSVPNIFDLTIMKFSTLIILCVALINLTSSTILDTSGELLSRKKRFLIWHEGVNWVQFIAGIGLPMELREQSITIGSVFKAFYTLPTNASAYTRPSIDYLRRKRTVTRWTIYDLIEISIDRYGDGKACLLKSICEIAAKPFERKTGILAEILHEILTPSSTAENPDNHLDSVYLAAEKLGKETDNCAALYPECSINILQQFTRFME